MTSNWNDLLPCQIVLVHCYRYGWRLSGHQMGGKECQQHRIEYKYDESTVLQRPMSLSMWQIQMEHPLLLCKIKSELQRKPTRLEWRIFYYIITALLTTWATTPTNNVHTKHTNISRNLIKMFRIGGTRALEPFENLFGFFAAFHQNSLDNSNVRMIWIDCVKRQLIRVCAKYHNANITFHTDFNKSSNWVSTVDC